MLHSALVLSLTIFFSSMAAGAFPLLWHWSAYSFNLLTSFAAGVLITIAMVHMLPAGFPVLGEQAGIFILLGFLAIFLFERFGPSHTRGEEHCHHIGWSALVGLVVHSFVGGVALGASLEEQKLALALLSAILIHKMPETLAIAGLLLQSHWKKKEICIAVFILSIMEPLGILFSSQTLLSHRALAMVTAASAGMFLYVATQEFLPTLFRAAHPPWRKLAAFFIGIGIVLLV